MSVHGDIIGTVDWDGETYEIDWPYQLDNDVEREIFGAVYLDGVQVGEFCPALGDKWTHYQDVLIDAFEFISNGGLDR